MARSRLMTVREKRELQQAVALIAVTLALLVFFIFWGLPALARFVGNTFIRSNDSSPSKTTELKPTVPILSDIPEATNSGIVNIDGFAQPGVEVELFVNNEQKAKLMVSDTGTFVFPAVPLADGENKIYAYATNLTNKLESDQSKPHTVVVDKTKPKITISSPNNDSVFHTDRERVVTISGSVDEEGVKVYVGERLAIVTPEKTFSVPYQLAEGDQEIVIKATDKAGNEEESKLKLRWEK